MSKNAIRSLIKAVQDFPINGVSFKDITPLLKEGFHLAINEFENLFTSTEWNHVDYVAGIESRGFVFAAALAERLGKGVVLIRKPGKLPGPTARMSCVLEYGETTLEMQYGAGNVVIIDDVLAMGGTLKAAADLCIETGYHVQGMGVLMNLAYLNHFEWNGLKVRSILEMTE